MEAPSSKEASILFLHCRRGIQHRLGKSYNFYFSPLSMKKLFCVVSYIRLLEEG
ncbi:hypothetical protein LguiA_014021 [Lonicera macranthoides]